MSSSIEKDAKDSVWRLPVQSGGGWAKKRREEEDASVEVKWCVWDTMRGE